VFKRRRIWFALLAVVALTVAGLYESITHVGRGWLCGEAFYQGRPTSYWAEEIDQWYQVGTEGEISGETWYTTYSRGRYWPLSHFSPFDLTADWPKLLDGDADGEKVLQELLAHPSYRVNDWARIGLERIQNGERGPKKTQHGLPDT
jgi:hypothetical protein